MKTENVAALGAGVGIPAGLYILLRMNEWLFGSVVLLIGLANLFLMFYIQRTEYTKEK